MKIIRYPQDIFKLNYKKIEKLDGWGDQSVNNLRFSIEEKRKISLEKFIYALGIRHVGIETAKLISKNIQTSMNFLKLDLIVMPVWFLATRLKGNAVKGRMIVKYC